MRRENLPHAVRCARKFCLRAALVADCCNQLAQESTHALSFLRTMTSGTTASLICPACGQAFLSMQQSMEGMVQCPHCAHNAQRGYFGTQAQVVGVAQVRRRVSQTQPLQSMPSPAPQQPHVVSQPAAWPGLQPLPAQASAPLIARPTLQYSQALMPTGSPSPQSEEFTKPPHMRSTPWRGAFILLSFMVVCGGLSGCGGIASMSQPPNRTVSLQCLRLGPWCRMLRSPPLYRLRAPSYRLRIWGLLRRMRMLWFQRFLPLIPLRVGPHAFTMQENTALKSRLSLEGQVAKKLNCGSSRPYRACRRRCQVAPLCRCSS